MTGDAVLYWHGTTHYAGCFDGEWLRWPACQNGWQARKRITERDVNMDREIDDPHLADLALRLTGGKER